MGNQRTSTAFEKAKILAVFCCGLLVAMAPSLAQPAPTQPAPAQPPPERVAALRRGVNITGWFRYPGSRDPAALRRWIGDAAIADLARVGFGFVRLAVDPALFEAQAVRPVLIEAIRRLHAQRLAVVVGPHPNGWRLETDAMDRARLLAFWRDLAPLLRPLDPSLTFPEVLNEPVFPNDPAAWGALQHRTLLLIREALPNATIVLTGNDWGSIAGLRALQPEADRNVVYSFHFYDPSELTSLAAYRPGLDRAALARLPFPWNDGCASIQTDRATAELIRYVCELRWDRDRIAASLATASEWARRHNAALLLGEFGASIELNPLSRLAWLSAVREIAEAAGIGWALWGYDDVMGLAVSRPPLSRPDLDSSVLTALGLTPKARLRVQ